MNLNYIMLDAAAGQDGGGMQMIIMMVLLFAIFYFLMIRPQQKKQKQIRTFRESLKNGDNVITAGGIHGTIKEINTNNGTLLLSIAQGVNIRIDMGSVYPTAAEAQAQEAQKK